MYWSAHAASEVVTSLQRQNSIERRQQDATAAAAAAAAGGGGGGSAAQDSGGGGSGDDRVPPIAVAQLAISDAQWFHNDGESAVRVQMNRHARTHSVGKYQSCMF